jgi:hypothetical protein
MALVFQTRFFEPSPDFDILHFTFINKVIEYTHDTALIPLTSDITFPGLPPITIYPSPTGNFYFNFKEYVSRAININRFADNLDYIGSYFYDWTDKIYLNSIINIKINYTDETSDDANIDIAWLMAVCQKYDYNTIGRIERNSFTLLTPMAKRADKVAFNRMWNGYPFDYTIYNGLTDAVGLVRNVGGGPAEIPPTTYSVPNLKIVRAFTFAPDALPIILPTRTVTEFKNMDDGNALLFTLYSEVEMNPCQGTYLKWINGQGGWNYWLFEKQNTIKSIKTLGLIDNDYYNIPDSISTVISMGTTSDETIKTVAERMNENDKLILDSIFDSPKIYLFTGVPLVGPLNQDDWLEIRIKANSFPIEQYNRKIVTYNLELDLPQRNTMTL